MKIRKLIALVLYLATIACTQADDYTLPLISIDFHGTWIPDSFVTKFHETLNYTISYRYESAENRPHDILIVEDRKIWSNLAFHDGYAISAREFAGFKLERTATGPSIIDDRGNSYVRISEAISANAPYIAFQTYLLQEIQEFLDQPTKHPVVLIEGNQLRFQTQVPAGPPYEVLLDTFGFEDLDLGRYNILLYNRNCQETLGLVIRNNSIEVWVLFEILEMEEEVRMNTSYDSRLIYRLKRK